MLILLWLGPVLAVAGAFVFGVLVQALGLVGAAKHGGLLGNLGGMALTVLIAGLLCMPGYVIGVIWYGWQTRSKEEHSAANSSLWAIPFVSLTMCWMPAVLIPKLDVGVRVQVAGFTVLLMLLFGYLWVLVVRLLMAAAEKAHVVEVEN